MTLNCTLVEAIHDNVDRTDYVFASHTFTAGRLYLCCVGSTATSSPPTVSTITGATASFTVIASDAGLTQVRTGVWRYAPSSTVTETLTVHLTGTSTSGDCILIEVTGQDTSGTNGSGAIVQSLGSSGAAALSGLITLAALESGNLPFGFFHHRANETCSAGTNFTSLDTAGHTLPNAGTIVEWSSTTADNTVDASWATSAAWSGEALELKLATSGSTGTVAYTNINDTSAASGTTTIVGTLAKTNVNDTSAASGTTTVLGTLAKTNANDTVSASGTTTITGTLAKTNANDTCAAQGSVGLAVTGTLATTNANDSASAAGTTTIVGSLSKTNANDSSASSGTTTITGTLAKTNANDTAAASGTAGSVSGTSSTTNADDNITASGSIGSATQVIRGNGGGFGYEIYRPGQSKKQRKKEVEELIEQAEEIIEKYEPPGRGNEFSLNYNLLLPKELQPIIIRLKELELNRLQAEQFAQIQAQMSFIRMVNIRMRVLLLTN